MAVLSDQRAGQDHFLAQIVKPVARSIRLRRRSLTGKRSKRVSTWIACLVADTEMPPRVSWVSWTLILLANPYVRHGCDRVAALPGEARSRENGLQAHQQEGKHKASKSLTATRGHPRRWWHPTVWWLRNISRFLSTSCDPSSDVPQTCLGRLIRSRRPKPRAGRRGG